jgi:hypothetical protein
MEEVADAVDREVGGWISCETLRVEGVMSLPRKHGGQPVLEDLCHSREDSLLVIHQDIVVRREARRPPQAGSLDLARLEDNIAIRQDHGQAPAAKMRNRGSASGYDRFTNW